MDAAALENELYSTVSDKQVFLVRLRQLRAEVRLVEASLELVFPIPVIPQHASDAFGSVAQRPGAGWSRGQRHGQI
eukprot:s531_g6.t1